MFIEVYHGPMFSGKSTKLIELFTEYSKKGNKVITVNHSFDTRYSTHGYITTHDTISLHTNLYHFTLSSLLQLFEMIDLDNSNVIIIDETQFFSDSIKFIHELENIKYNGIVIFGGLLTDSNRNVFGEMGKLIAIADKNTLLQGKCEYCDSPSLFSKKIKTTHDELIDIGSHDKYIPVCRNCFNEL